MKYESYYKNKVTFNDKIEEFDYINSYEDFIKKCCEIFNITEKEEINLYYINENQEKKLIDKENDYIKCSSDDDGYYIFEIQIKEMKNESIINSKSKNENNQSLISEEKKEDEDEENENININPSKIKVTLVKEEKEFDYIDNLDDVIKKCIVEFDISDIMIIQLYNIRKNQKILIENNLMFISCIPDKKGYLYFDIQLKIKEIKIVSFSENKISENEYLNEEDSFINKLKESFPDFNNFNGKDILKEFKEKFEKKIEEFQKENEVFINSKINEINENINQQFSKLNIVLKKILKDISKKSFLKQKNLPNQYINYQITKNNKFSLIPEKEKIIFNQKSQIQNLKKHYSCEFKQKEYIFNFTNSTINEIKEIRVKNNGDIKWPKGCKIYLKKKNDKIKLFGETENEVNPGEEIDIKLNIIIDVNIEKNFKFNSNLIISYKDNNLFSFNQCEIQIIIRNENVENKIPKSNKGKTFKNIINKSYNYNISNSAQKSLNKSYSIQEFYNNNSYTQIYKKKYRKNSLNKCASKQNNLLIFQ